MICYSHNEWLISESFKSFSYQNELYKSTWSSPGIRLFRADEELRQFPGQSFHTFGESVWFIDLPQKTQCLFMLWLKISMRRRFSLQITRRVVQEGGGVFDIDSSGCHTVSGHTGQFWGTQWWGWCWQGFCVMSARLPGDMSRQWWLFICKQRRGGNSNRWCPRGVSSKHSGPHSLGSLPPSLTKLTNFWTEVESQGMPSHWVLVEDMTLQEQIQSYSTHVWITRLFREIYFELGYFEVRRKVSNASKQTNKWT